MVETTVVVHEPKTLNCEICGAKPSVQRFGPSVYIQGIIEMWVCSNHTKLGGTCSHDVGYMSLDDWNEGNANRETHEDPKTEVDISSEPVSSGDRAIIDLIKYQAACKQVLTAAGLWSEELQSLRDKAYHAIDSICVSDSHKLANISGIEVEYDDSDDSVVLKHSDGKTIFAMADKSIIVGDSENSDKSFIKYDFEELTDRHFEFGDISVSIEVDKYPYQTEVINTLVDGTIVRLKSNGNIVVKEVDDDYSFETTLEELLLSPETLQRRKDKWMRACFSNDITDDPKERNRRFLEEALELVQSLDMDRNEAHFMVDYVFTREKGETFQEVGGAILTLAALCNAHKIDLMNAAESELSRVWGKIGVIRSKQKKKPEYFDLVNSYLSYCSTEELERISSRSDDDLAYIVGAYFQEQHAVTYDRLTLLHIVYGIKRKILIKNL